MRSGAAARLLAAGALLLWCSATTAQELVHFTSSEDNGPGRSSTALDGYLFRPAGEGRHPAVVFLHGCGGLFDRMSGFIEPGERDWAAELTRRGYVVLMVDSFAPRNQGEQCSPRSRDPELYRKRPRDAYGALLFLQTQPFVRPDRVGVIGWSQGGGAVLFAIGAQGFARPPSFRRETSERRSPSTRHRATRSASRRRGRVPSRFSCWSAPRMF